MSTAFSYGWYNSAEKENNREPRAIKRCSYNCAHLAQDQNRRRPSCLGCFTKVQSEIPECEHKCLTWTIYVDVSNSFLLCKLAMIMSSWVLTFQWAQQKFPWLRPLEPDATREVSRSWCLRVWFITTSIVIFIVLHWKEQKEIRSWNASKWRAHVHQVILFSFC